MDYLWNEYRYAAYPFGVSSSSIRHREILYRELISWVENIPVFNHQNTIMGS
jgi:hypothetical protein